MSKGWIKLHRKIQENPIWANNQPFDMRSAWIDLLLLANHEDNQIMFDYEQITVARGQHLTSVRQLSARWSWSKNRVLKFLRLLESLQMITRNSNTKRTLITIVKYEVFQDWRDTDEDTVVYTGMDTGVDTGMPQTRMIKNEKNINILSENFEDTQKAKNAKEIIEYLNVILGSRYTTKNKNIMSMINARLTEGHTVDDFKTVIDKKNRQWRGDPRMVGYLRPETLFCAKHFESYLNEQEAEPATKPKTQNKFVNFEQRERSKEEWAELYKDAFGE